MALGPVLRYELITTSRRPRYYWARFLYGLILLLILLQHANQPQRNYLYEQYDTQTSLRYMAESAFATIGGSQAVALLFLTPAMVAGVIADEARRKTLYDLFSSGLSSWSIVFGKLGSRLVHALVLLAIGFPIVAIIELLGGLDPWIVLYVYAGTLTTVFAVGSLSMLVSVVARSPREATLASYALVIAWLFGPLFLTPIFESSPWPMNLLTVLNQKVMMSNPLWMGTWLQSTAEMQNHPRYFPGGARWIAPAAVIDPTEFHWMIGLQLAIGLSAIILSVVLLRPVRGFGDGSGSIRWKQLMGARFSERVRHSRVIFTRKSCGDVPMFWKERRATHRGGLAWLAGRPLALVVIIIMGCFLFEAALPAFREMLESRKNGIVSYHSRRYLNEMIREMGTYVFILWMIVVACAAAVSVTEEKESDAWTSLTATLLTGREIILGKLFGALWSSQWIGLALLAMIGIGLIAGALHPIGALLAILGLVIYGTFAASLGIAVSLRAKNSPRALLWTIAILALINIGSPLMVSVVGQRQGGGPEPLFLTAAAPYIERISLMSSENLHRMVTSGMKSISLYSMMSLLEYIALIMISYVIYGVSALILTAQSIRSFDHAAGRPRRLRAATPSAAIQPAS